MNLNSSRNAEVAGIEESINTSEVTTEIDSDRDIYLEIENNYKKHENLFTGTYSLNNIYNLKNSKYVVRNIRISNIVKKIQVQLLHQMGNFIMSQVT
ncbi:hypothetical protein CM15mP35_02140 [bacterium]|nr:MAG: hypothetical protein CM15mP35_02140 [bacterium]